MAWVESNAVAIVAAIVALYGAILSTITYRASRRDKRRVIGARLSYGFLTFGPKLSDPHLLLHASNPGQVPVTLRSAVVVLPDKWQAIVPPGQGESRLPLELAPGAGCTFWLDAREIAGALRQRGYAGKVRIHCEFGDATGENHRSKPFKFDIDGWKAA